jgi:hypothetical protein
MTLWRKHPYLVAAFALALALTLFFAGRFVVQVAYWSDPAHRNQTVQGWMTVGYVGRSWGLDPREIDDIAGLPRPEGHPKPLVEIAAERGVPVTDLIAEVEAAIVTLKAREK